MVKMAGIEDMIVILRDAGAPLVLLWLLTLAVVYGMLHHAKIPQSNTAKGVIALSAAFLVLLASAASPAVAFLQNLVVAGVLIAVGLLVAVIFLEIGQVKTGGTHIFMAHPKFFGGIILLILLSVFIGAGGLSVINISVPEISDTLVAIVIFAIIIAVAFWFMYKEGMPGGDKK